MKAHMIRTYKLLTFNLKSLVIFESLYRLFGVVIIYPIINQLLFLSIRLTGNQYIITTNFIDYIYRPTTIIIFIFLFLLISLYVAYEIVVLSILFHSNTYKETITVQTLLIASWKKFRVVIRKYHIIIMSSSMIFFLLVEGLHVAGIASTVKIPQVILQEFQSNSLYYFSIIIAIILVVLLFIETIFFELQCTIETPSISSNFGHSKTILKKKRFTLIIEFLIVNGLLNFILYSAYLLILILLAIFTTFVRGESTTFGVVLSLLYSIYLIVGVLATVILIPVNFAWINIWYYEHKKTPQSETQKAIRRIKQNKPFTNVFFRRVLTVVAIILIMISTILISSSNSNFDRISFLNNPSIISHRGAGDYAPENTLSSIEKGIDIGADAIEIDVRFTSDGIPILMHDSTTQRTTDDNQYRRVNQLTLLEIKELDAGSWFSDEYIGEQVPTLEEALLLVDRRANVYIDLKSGYENGEEILIEVIRATNMENNVKILSFNQSFLESMKLIENKIDTVLLLSSYVGDVTYLKDNKSIDYYGFKNTYLESNNQIIFELQESGKGVYVWTINDTSKIEEMSKLGVDGIITDTPILAREIVYSDRTSDMYTELIRKIFVRKE